VQLDSKVKLLDSPGLVMAGGNRNDASVALRNAIKVENLDDPITPVLAILDRVPRTHLMVQYSLGHFKDCSEFLALLAIQMGKLKRGGIPDREKAARILLGDWNSGKIKYFTHPPETLESNLGAEIVSQFATEFSLDAVDQTDEMKYLPNVKPSDIVQVESGKMIENAQEGKDEEEEMEEDEEVPNLEDSENILPERIEVIKNTRKRKEDAAETAPGEDPLFKLEGNLKMKKIAKLQQKKNKKNAKRSDKLAAGLSDQMESAFSSIVEAEDYSFKNDFTD